MAQDTQQFKIINNCRVGFTTYNEIFDDGCMLVINIHSVIKDNKRLSLSNSDREKYSQAIRQKLEEEYIKNAN